MRWFTFEFVLNIQGTVRVRVVSYIYFGICRLVHNDCTIIYDHFYPFFWIPRCRSVVHSLNHGLFRVSGGQSDRRVEHKPVCSALLGLLWICRLRRGTGVA